jgi:CheY-like chemotaxis protein
MNGKIGLESENGQGTTFWVDFPVSRQQEDRQVAKIDSLQITPAAEPSGPIKTILYVEDNPENLMLMEHILRRVPDYKLISAHTAELGLEMATSERPDFIILDINLPGMNAIEAMTELQKMSETRDIPVIALSANALPDRIQHGLNA